MKYVCFGYLDTERWSKLSPSEQTAAMDACFAYDEDVLRKNGHWVYGEGLQGPETATTLRYQNGKVGVTDGPYAETKEQFGGFHIVECRDMDEALAIASRIPTLRVGGTIEVRPVEPRA